MNVLAWGHGGLTLTCTRDWLTLRSDTTAVRLRGEGELRGYARLARATLEAYERHHPGDIRAAIGGHTFVMQVTPASDIVLSINGSRTYHVIAGDLMDQVAWICGEPYPNDDCHEIGLAGTTLTLVGPAGARSVEIPDGNLAGLAALLRQGAAIANGGALPGFRSGPASFTLIPGTGHKWNRLHYNSGGNETCVQLGKTSLMRIADKLEEER